MARGPIPDKPPNRPTVPDVLPLVQRFLAREWNGGGLHCALVDGNLESAFFADAVDDPDPECAEIARKMLAMTSTQRRRIYHAT